MMMTDVLREAGSEHEILFLLTAYVEAVRYSDRLGILPAPLRGLPVAGADDLRERIETLRDWGRARPGMDLCEQSVLSEALDIFSVARGRLDSLERGRGERLAA